MGNIMGGFSHKGAANKADTVESILSYEDSYMKLLRRYKDDIVAIEEMMRELRAEREQFYLEKLPAISREMESDEVPPEIRMQWLETVQHNVEKSFKISESLIDHYVVKNLNEFELELQQTLGKV